ncbi:MAG TPA: hypothetical protein VEI97_08605 [bacterium]|nr:hypothetical protein [bacterium]
MARVHVNGPLRARDFERITATTASVGFTAAKMDKEVTVNDPFSRIRRVAEVVITVETADIRWTCDGTTPTTTATTAIGHLAQAGDDIVLTGYDNIKAFRCINAVASSGSALSVTFFFE